MLGIAASQACLFSTYPLNTRVLVCMRMFTNTCFSFRKTLVLLNEEIFVGWFAPHLPARRARSFDPGSCPILPLAVDPPCAEPRHWCFSARL